MDCKSGENCWNKGCSYNHPQRTDCRFGTNCQRPDCTFNHPNKVCVFGEGCRNLPAGTCPFRHSIMPIANAAPSTPAFRHPLRNAGPAAIAGTSRPRSAYSSSPIRPGAPSGHPLEWTSPNSNSSSSLGGSAIRAPNINLFTSMTTTTDGYTTHETRIIAAHQRKIDNVNNNILNILSNPELDLSEKSSYIGTLEALRKEVIELKEQLEAYNAVRARAFSTMSGDSLKRLLNREIYRLKSRLPALAKRREIEQCLENFSPQKRFAIIQGETGSGKSSQIPQYLADHPMMKDKKILCTQPRKIAAISLATRVSVEFAGGNEKAKVGYQVGYRVGGGKVTCKKARIEFLTEGKLLEKIMSVKDEDAKYIANVGAIVIDEAHERSMVCDILLGTLKKNDPRWKDILVVVTSATIDLDVFSRFFNNAKTVQIPGRTFPVERNYHPVPDSADIVKAVAACALEIHKSAALKGGDILCFLPGQEDVLKAQGIVENQTRNLQNSGRFLNAQVFSLFGRQDPSQQAEVFKKLPNNARKIIFATDVAETSITIDGVVYVVDSGVKKEMSFDAIRNIASLKVQTISKSSAIQREGRAGRTRPGVCYRLYSQEDYEAMQTNTLPEIFRRPLPLAILLLRAMGIPPLEFDWISSPSKEAIFKAEEELKFLGAIDEDNQLTDIGKLISDSQQEPKTVRMIHRGMEQGLGSAAIRIASILSVANMFFWSGKDPPSSAAANECRKRLSHPEGDVVTMFHLYGEYRDIIDGKLEKIEENVAEKTASEDVIEEESEYQFNIGIESDDLVLHEDAGSEKESTVGDEISERMSEVTLDSENRDLEQDDVLEDNGTKEAEQRVDHRTLLQNRKRLAMQWCQNNYINAKALRLVDSLCRELKSIFQHSEKWKLRNQERNPVVEEILGLFVAGYFLHAARKVNVKTGKAANMTSYYAIYPEITGSLHFKSSLLAHGVTGNHPEWTIFDKILRLQTTLFPTTVRIDPAWIEKECPSFYASCTKKETELSTDIVERQVSPACIRAIFGKLFINLDTLEAKFKSSVVVDLVGGFIKVLCSSPSKPFVEALLDTEIAKAKESFRLEVVEEQHVGSTRIVLGEGYQVEHLLFGEEYTTLYIKDLHPSVDLAMLENLFKAAGCRGWRSINFTKYESSSLAVVKMLSAEEARNLLEQITGEVLGGKVLNVSPFIQKPSFVRAAESERLKLSWALFPSTGRASLIFSSVGEANNVLERLEKYPIWNLKSSYPIGERNVAEINSKKPKVIRIPVGMKSYQNRFLEGQSNFTQFWVGLDGLPFYMDELVVLNAIKGFCNPLRVVIERKETLTTTEQSEKLVMEEREEKLQHLRPHMDSDTVTTDFFEKEAKRAGMYIHLKASSAEYVYYRVHNLYRNMYVNGQPILLELDRTLTITVHADLYEYFKEVILCAVASFKSMLGVSSSIIQPNLKSQSKTKFTSIKLRHPNLERLQQCRRQLENITRPEEFKNSKVANLFTWTGREMMKKIEEDVGCFIHWDNQKQQIYIYSKQSDARMIDVAKVRLNKTAEEIEVLKTEVFEEPVILNKRKGVTENQVAQIVSTTVPNISRYHFLKSASKLFVSGSPESLQALKGNLEKEGILLVRRKQSNMELTCGICTDQVDPNFMTTSLCQHAFCIICINNMFGDLGERGSIPVECPSPGCGLPFPLSDVVKAAAPTALPKLCEIALNLFLQKNKEKYVICPTLGCEQVLDRAIEPHSVYCDICLNRYCLDCTETLGKGVKDHPYESCEDARRGLGADVLLHLNHIRDNIFTLKCPRCKSAFLDFTGCAAVTCRDPCRAAFCGICLCDCGNDAHQHVKTCPKNPSPGSYFVSNEQVEQAWRDLRTTKLREYCMQTGISNQGELRQKLIKALRQDFVDLRIDASVL